MPQNSGTDNFLVVLFTGTHLCINSPVDPALLQLVQQELKSLEDSVKDMSIEFEEERKNIQHELQNVAATLKEMEQSLQMMECGQGNINLQ